MPAEHDLLIYAKSGYQKSLIRQLRHSFRRARVLVYGKYRREELFDLARRCRCCVYLSDDDQGSLASGEIMLAGCPAVGIPRGAPRIVHGVIGYLVDVLDPLTTSKAVEECYTLDREAVRAAAFDRFDTGRIVDTVLQALNEARRG